MRILVTGSNGLIGSAVCTFFGGRGWNVHGIDNNQRAVFFGPEGDTRWNQRYLAATIEDFTHHELDIRDREGMLKAVADVAPDAIVHTAAQPSHDKAAQIPFADFETNAVGTLNLLEAARRHALSAPFVHMSTNKVYGDAPNRIPLKELATRYEYADPAFQDGIGEDFPIDQSLHSLFGASKLASDVLVQEYGRYFAMPTCCLRGGCLTGASHSGVELHGFLSYLVKCNVERKPYRIFGYRGKQVRDNIHSRDVAQFIQCFIEAPRCGEVYNIGGGKGNTCSILEAFRMVGDCTGIEMRSEYVDQHRVGDHICYYTNLAKARDHYPGWDVQIDLQAIVEEMVDGWQQRLKA
ncbi:MAG: NAD-dependent epimerase [Planctomycetes bacterium SM23_32]|nr:MAG: NAD-dependent epimerase [Planctomycetes bacterium SM23_32]